MSVLTPPQVAKRWGCKPESVIALVRTGALRGFTVSPPGTKRPRWRITLDAVVEYESGNAGYDRHQRNPGVEGKGNG